MQRLLSPMHHTARLLPITALSAKQRHAMAALYLAHYNASSPALFQRDLSAKDEVIVLEHEGALAGFTALQTWPLRWRGQDMRVLYSGDTIVAPAHWGQQTLALAWLERVGLLLRQAPTGGLWWFLLVKGHRTYKYLSTFARAFHPRWAQAHPGWQALADHLAAQRFGLQYNPATGVVRFDSPQGHLRPELVGASPADAHKPATAHFLARNPGYRQGDELGEIGGNRGQITISLRLALPHPDTQRRYSQRRTRAVYRA